VTLTARVCALNFFSLIFPTAPIQHPRTYTFGPLKEDFRGRRFADDDDDDELKHSVPEEIRCFGKEFPGTGIQRLAQRWKECVDKEENGKIISAL
jgi:hypothetical protein